MFDKIYQNREYIFGAVLIIAFALVGYGLGSESKTNKLCKQLGGIYVQTWSDGYACIHAQEIPLK
jgi:hypothetical protein